MRLVRRARISAKTRRWLLVTVAAAVLLAAGLVALRPWTVPSWLVRVRQIMVMPSQLTRSPLFHLFAVTVGIAGIAIRVLLWRLQRAQRQPPGDERSQARDRAVMLRRVRYRWITGVLAQSLAREARLQLGLMRRPNAVWQQDMIIRRRAGNAEPVSAGMSIGRVFDEVGGRLLILGAPGSGKTTALLELACDLLDRAETDPAQPMPVVFNLSSWTARRPPLAQWLINELHIRYDVPGLIARSWVTTGEIVPLLDGLDEVAKAYRDSCIAAINAFRITHGLARYVVCSRTEEYVTLKARLQAEEAVELQLPTRQQVDDYLAAAGDALADVRATLAEDDSLWEFLQSPLVLSIVALTYRGRPATALRAAGTSQQRLALLFQAYIERMLAYRPARFPSARMLHWLSWLARTMREHSQTEFHPDRLQPEWLPTKAARQLAVLMPAVTVGLVVGLGMGLHTGWLAGLAVGLSFMLAVGLMEAEPAEEVRWSWPKVRSRFITVLLLGLSTVIVVLILVATGLIDVLGALLVVLATVPVSALVLGVRIGLIGGLSDERTTPNEGIYRSIRHALALGLLTALVVGVIAQLLSHFLTWLGLGIIAGVIGGLIGVLEARMVGRLGILGSLISGLSIGLVAGLSLGLGHAISAGIVLGLLTGLTLGGLACLQHLAMRILLAAHGFAPLRYIRFLNDATEQLLLRRAGSGYIFAHRLLLEYFAELE
jgi:eukaryotic-like serine/threonine-protein kinase